jgi:L-type amino acid transporter 9
VNLPRAIIIGISLVTVCYLAINVAYLTVLSPAALIKSDAVAVVYALSNAQIKPFYSLIDFITQMWIRKLEIICLVRWLLLFRWLLLCPLSVRCSQTSLWLEGIKYKAVKDYFVFNFNRKIIIHLVISRICFSSAREGHMLDILSYVHVDSRTPFPALIFTVKFKFSSYSFNIILNIWFSYWFSNQGIDNIIVDCVQRPCRFDRLFQFYNLDHLRTCNDRLVDFT